MQLKNLKLENLTKPALVIHETLVEPGTALVVSCLKKRAFSERRGE